MKRLASAGAVLVSTDLRQPKTLLLDQERHDGEQQTVAPKGRIEPGESPLVAARREVMEETGVTDLLYAGYLGQQAYGYTDADGLPGKKTVDWFLFATATQDVTPRRDEGFLRARWVPLDQAADVSSHAAFGEYLDRCRDLAAWRRSASGSFSRTLSDLVGGYTRYASTIVAGHTGVGVALCGSAARGDFVDGWSDVDLIAWGVAPSSTVGYELQNLTHHVERRHGIRTSLRLADANGTEAHGAGPLYDMKLRAAFSRFSIDVPVIAGGGPVPDAEGSTTDDLVTGIQALHDFTVERLATTASSRDGRTDRARRVLSVVCSAARIVVMTLDPTHSLRLPAVASVLNTHWPGIKIAGLLTEYDAFRRGGAADISVVEELAEQAPDAIQGLRDRVSTGQGDDRLR